LKALIKIGGSLLDDAASRAEIARQILGLKGTVAVVHGGGKQMTRFLSERGIASRFINGLRVTTEDTMDAVLKVLAGTVNTQLVAALGDRAVGLTGVDAGLAIAEQLDPDLGFVGRVTGSDPKILNVLTAAGYLPVVACVAGGHSIYNVNGDSMAVALASKWKVDLLVFLTDVAGVMDAEKNIIPELMAADCRRLIEAGVATGGMQAKLNAAIEAVANGVREVRIVNGSDIDIVTRIFAGDAVGTAVAAGTTVI
jgi:acetylglutamate kinase